MSNAYRDFFLSAPADVVELELIEISHPSLSQSYRYVRNHRAGVTVTLPNGGPTAFEYRPAIIRRGRSSDDIAQSISVDLGDPGDVLANEMDLMIANDSYQIKPVLKYWVYRSDDLANALVGPLTFDVLSISTKGDMATLEAQAPERNLGGTGALYTFNRFPMLRGEL